MIDSNADMIDVRDIIEYVESWSEDTDDKDEYEDATQLLNELRGNGGDERWRGNWYPPTLIRDSYFIEYAERLASDIGAINPGAGWPLNHIDWDAAANDLKMDYTTVEFDGVTYWYR